MDDNLKKIELEDLKKIQIKILDVVANFCQKNNIKYWIDSGTLLGAIRHSGYIPWDDDIDVGMLREDFDKFLKLFNTENSQYKAYSIENKDDFYYTYCKVLDTNTILYEPDKNGNKLSVNIDVFVYDNAPDDDKKIQKMFKIRDKYRYYHEVLNCNLDEKTEIKKLIIRFARIIFKRNYFMKKMVVNEKKYMNKETLRVGNFSGYFKAYCEKSVFNDFIDVTFEGKKYKAPIGYDKWLRAFYNDYMKLPPKEKRVSHHRFEAYYGNKYK